MHDDQYTCFNRNGPGNNVSTFQNIASRARKEIASIKLINEDVLKLQSEYEKIDKVKYNYDNRKTLVTYLSHRYLIPDFISVCLMSLELGFNIIFLCYKAPIYDATGTLLLEIHSIKNDNGNPKRIIIHFDNAFCS